METTKNADAVVSHVVKTGFPDTHEAEIRNGMNQGLDQFTVNIPAVVEGISTDNTLLFKKGQNNDYYFNEYESRISNRPEDEVGSRPVKEKVNTRFPKNTITLQESISLRLTGSVEKEISYLKLNPSTGVNEVKRFTTWKKADQTTINEYGQFPLLSFKFKNMEADLRRKAIVGKNDPDKWNEILTTLKSGGSVEMTLKNGKNELTKWAAVNADIPEITLYDSNPRLNVARKLLLGQSKTSTPEQAKQDAKVIPLYAEGTVPVKATDAIKPSEVLPVEKVAGKTQDLPGESDHVFSEKMAAQAVKKVNAVNGSKKAEGKKSHGKKTGMKV